MMWARTAGRVLVAAAAITGLLVTAGCAPARPAGVEPPAAAGGVVSPSPGPPSPGPPSPGLAARGPTTTTSAAPEAQLAPQPEPGPAERAEVWAEARLAQMSLAEKVQSLFMLHVPGTDADAFRAFAEHNRPGGMILMGDNIPSGTTALAGLTAAASPDPELPLLFAVDQEGGVVSRLHADTAPGADQLKHDPVGKTYTAFRSRASLLREAGIQINFGVVADVSADPGSFIYDRVLGVDPQAAAERVAQAVRGESGLVLSTLKHFPGHGTGVGDSHQLIPQTKMSRAHWRERDGRPFAAGIVAGAELVMLGHLEYSEVDAQPASLSPVWHRILRDDLDFHGVIISDDMLMLQHSGLDEYRDPSENAIRALAAGTTMLLYVLPANPSTAGIDLGTMVSDIMTAVDTGRIDPAQVDQAARALLVLRRTSVEENQP